MSPILDLSSSDNWSKIYEIDIVAAPGVIPGSYYPIGNHQIPGSFDSHTLLIGASSFKAKATWRLGFYLIASCVAPGVGKFIADRKAIVLGLSLIRLAPLSAGYTLAAAIPKWHQEMSITIWKYTGLESDSRDLIQSVEQDVIRIEGKIDALS